MHALKSVFLLLLSPIVATAGDFKIGDEVFLKPGAQGMVDGTKTSRQLFPTSGKIAEVNGEKLLIGRVWFEKSDAMIADGALEFYDRQIAVNRTSALLWERRGAVRLETGDLRGAISDFNEAIRLDPTYSMTYANRGCARCKINTDKSLEDFNEAIQLDQSNGKAYRNRAMLYLEMKQFDRAIEDCTKAIDLDPTDSKAYCNRSVAYHFNGELKNAIKDLNEAIRLAPTDATAYFNRGSEWGTIGRLEHAIEDYGDAIRLDPSYVMAYTNRAAIWQMKGDYDNAIKDCSHAILLEPTNALAYFTRGLAWKMKDMPSNAFSDFRKVISVNDTDANAYCCIAWLEATCSDEQYRNGREAVEHARRACDLTAWNQPEFVAVLAAAYAEAGDFANAINWQESAMERISDNRKTEHTERLEMFRANKPLRDVRKKER